jgi:hypothetical protein
VPTTTTTTTVPPGRRDKVAVCHKAKKTLYLPERALRGHLRHGDSLGACGEPPAGNGDGEDRADAQSTSRGLDLFARWLTGSKSKSEGKSKRKGR